MDIKIDKNIPIPDGRTRSRYGLVAHQMEVGDSVNVPTQEERNSVCNYLKALGYKAVTQKQEDKTYRIWRTT